VYTTIQPGKTITFQSGQKASGKYVLTKQYIYENNVKGEGVKVTTTTVGRYTDHC